MKVFVIESKLHNAKNWLPVTDKLYYSIKRAHLDMKILMASIETDSRALRLYQVTQYVRDKEIAHTGRAI